MVRSDREPEELWSEVRDIVQEAVINTTPKKKKCKKAKWLPEGALKIAEKRREATGKGEKERYVICKQREFHFFSYLGSFYFFFCPDCCGQYFENYVE